MNSPAKICCSALLVLFAFAVGCKHPPREDCERVCWKAGKLVYWDKKEAEIAKTQDADEKEILREEAAEEWAKLEKKRVDVEEYERCVVSCNKDGDESQVKCIDKAETAQAIRSCQSLGYDDD